jgi:hypothetical protein
MTHQSPWAADSATVCAPTEDELRAAVGSQRLDAARLVFAFNKSVLAEAMRALDLTSVTVNYSGSGDEGMINEISFQPSSTSAGSKSVRAARVKHFWHAEAEARSVSLVFEDANLFDLAEDLCDGAITLCGHNGYQNNDGGNGTFTLRAEDAIAELEHTDYFMESDTSVHKI